MPDVLGEEPQKGTKKKWPAEQDLSGRLGTLSLLNGERCEVLVPLLPLDEVGRPQGHYLVETVTRQHDTGPVKLLPVGQLDQHFTPGVLSLADLDLRFRDQLPLEALLVSFARSLEECFLLPLDGFGGVVAVVDV